MKIPSMKFAGLKTKPKILIGICSPLVLLMGLGAASVYSIDTIVETNERVDHTHVVLGEAAAIVSSAVDMETGMRGYLLAGQDGFLDPYHGGEDATYAGITALQETVDDNPAQVERLAEAERVLREWQEKVTEPTIQLRRDIGDAETMNDMAALVGEARGKVFFDKFREQIATFIGHETELMTKRQEEFDASEKAVEKNFELDKEANEWVNHAHEVLASVNLLLAHVVDMETGMRGFLLTGEDSFLEPYHSGSAEFFEEAEALEKQIDDNPEQIAELKETESLVREWMEQVTEPAIALRRQVADGEMTLEDVEALVSEKAGKVFVDGVRAQITAFTHAEETLMAQRREAALQAEANITESLHTMEKDEQLIVHTYGVIAVANDILAAAVDMETGMRGYLLAGEDGFLAPYTGGNERFHELVASLSETVNDNPAQVQLLAEAQQTIEDWQSNVTEPTIELRR